MKKTVEIEYVGVEDIQEIMDDAYALMREGHYVDIEMCNLNKDKVHIEVAIKLGGWEAYKDSDYAFSFYMTDEEKDVAEMNDCKHIIKSLLEEVGL